MGLISFKNFKLFKSSAATAPKNHGSAHAPEEENLSWIQRILRSPFPYIFIFALALAYFISYLPSKSLPQMKEGEIAASDIVAPADMLIEDAETTENRRRDAAEAVLPIYVYDPNVILNTGEKIRQFFLFGREWLSAPPAGKKDYAKFQKDVYEKFGLELMANELAALEKYVFAAELEEALIKLLEKYSTPGIILSKSLFMNQGPEGGFTLLRNQEGEKVIRVQDILEIKEVKDKLVIDINKLELAARKKGLLISLSFGSLEPNITFNKVETEARREKARASVETVFYTIKKGKVIIRKGDEASPETVKQIRNINRNLRGKKAWQRNFLGGFLLFCLIFVTLWYYLKSLLKPPTAFKYFLMMGLTLALSLFFYKLGLFLAETSGQSARFFLFQDVDSYKYALPFQFGVILFAFLTTNAVALIYAILNSLLVGYLINANFYFMIFSLIGGLGAIYGIKYYRRQKRTSALRTGLFVVAPLNIFIAVTLYLVKERWAAVDLLAAEVLMSLIGGFLSAALAFVLLPLYESLFRFLTQTKLLELTNSDSPLFRQMALEAPGSYHHSLIVASLAEKAAEEIKVDPLLVRAGALYHDIGKIKMPEYFIENKEKKIDAHKDLTPSMSTLVIINHVKEGVEIAKKEKLPQRIRDIIEQHHGNSLVRYFYQKAKEKYDPEMQKIGEETYRYPGPAPRSKEAALIMLADSIEAASRSLRSTKEENLKRVIKDIFDNYLQDGQLDDCNFSLKELRLIATSFLATLRTIYQPRVEYPGFDFEVKKKKSEPKPKNNHKDDNDRGHQPPED
jgi:hypothetical protein